MFATPAADAFTSMTQASDSGVAEMRHTVEAQHPGLRVTTESSADPAAGVLVHGLGADDLVVVGASRHDGFSALVLGSTSRQVLRDSPCPVAVVRGPASRGRPDRVVVGVDGSAASDQAVCWAGDEADRHHVALVIVHGWSYPYTPDDARSAQARQLTEIDAACTLDRCVETARAGVGSMCPAN
jgi:nucleotide-binding universal stress UspA family protein